MNIRIIGGLVGPILGLAGGFVGAYCSYKAARGPRERRFMIWASIAILAFVCSFLAALSLLPQAKGWVWTSYLILLPVGLRYLIRKQSAIQRQERPNA